MNLVFTGPSSKARSAACTPRGTVGVLRRRAAVLGALGIACLGCARGERLEHEIERLALALRRVEARGAMRCAPRELAIAQSRLEFATLERDQGLAARAASHLEIAEENLRAARLLTEPSRCAKNVLGDAAVPDIVPAGG